MNGWRIISCPECGQYIGKMTGGNINVDCPRCKATLNADYRRGEMTLVVDRPSLSELEKRRIS